MAVSVNYQDFKTLVEIYERAHPEKNKNTAQTVEGKVLKKMTCTRKVTNVSLPTIDQETPESVTTNYKANPQPSTETPHSTTNTPAPTPAQEKVKQKVNTDTMCLY